MNNISVKLVDEVKVSGKANPVFVKPSDRTFDGKIFIYFSTDSEDLTEKLTQEKIYQFLYQHRRKFCNYYNEKIKGTMFTGDITHEWSEKLHSVVRTTGERFLTPNDLYDSEWLTTASSDDGVDRKIPVYRFDKELKKWVKGFKEEYLTMTIGSPTLYQRVIDAEPPSPDGIQRYNLEVYDEILIVDVKEDLGLFDKETRKVEKTFNEVGSILHTVLGGSSIDYPKGFEEFVRSCVDLADFAIRDTGEIFKFDMFPNKTLCEDPNYQLKFLLGKISSSILNKKEVEINRYIVDTISLEYMASLNGFERENSLHKQIKGYYNGIPVIKVGSSLLRGKFEPDNTNARILAVSIKTVISEKTLNKDLFLYKLNQDSQRTGVCTVMKMSDPVTAKLIYLTDNSVTDVSRLKRMLTPWQKRHEESVKNFHEDRETGDKVLQEVLARQKYVFPEESIKPIKLNLEAAIGEFKKLNKEMIENKDLDASIILDRLNKIKVDIDPVEQSLLTEKKTAEEELREAVEWESDLYPNGIDTRNTPKSPGAKRWKELRDKTRVEHTSYVNEKKYSHALRKTKDWESAIRDLLDGARNRNDIIDEWVRRTTVNGSNSLSLGERDVNIVILRQLGDIKETCLKYPNWTKFNPEDNEKLETFLKDLAELRLKLVEEDK